MKNKIEDKREIVEEIMIDLDSWCKKINAMMLASVEGEAPQIYKAILFEKMGTFWTKQFKDNNKKHYLGAEKLMREFLEKFAKIKITRDKKEAEDIMYRK